ncbi:MAG: hypothetical protein KBS55_02535 [Bacteroidales bacterium]|nr:hypothetical protein [Candidatus Cryptobacteroides aphodequi]
MDEADLKLYDNYEKTLLDGLLKLCSGEGLLEGELLSSPDIDEKWDDLVRDFVADAVYQFNDYPEATIAWPAFIGIAIALYWDRDWSTYKGCTYKGLYGERGFDDLDEHVLRDLMGLKLDSPQAKKISGTLNNCALAAMGLIRHEGIEPQTSQGFFILARTYWVMYRIGAAIALRWLKYRLQPVG